MRSPAQIALEPFPQAHRVVMSVEQLVDQNGQFLAVPLLASSQGGRSGASNQHDFSSN